MVVARGVRDEQRETSLIQGASHEREKSDFYDICYSFNRRARLLVVAAGAGAGSKERSSAEADKIFMTRCASCHGIDGRGDGPGAANLTPKPRNYHDKAWQKTITDEQIEKTIVYGGAAVGKSPSMAANPDLADKPAVVHALCEHIRELGKE
jgi:cytochrome c553